MIKDEKSIAELYLNNLILRYNELILRNRNSKLRQLHILFNPKTKELFLSPSNVPPSKMYYH
ncbi:hypothetical protein HRbin06_01117 [archaeon HR06]|nr:hypothetical protein HRbin06_01117 [archaeon HR06]